MGVSGLARGALIEIEQNIRRGEGPETYARRLSADEARAIHYGDAPDRIIHGSATIDDARELHDEGISVAPLPLPFVPPEAKN